MLWDDYGQRPKIINYLTRKIYPYARLRFHEFQSGIFAYIDPCCHSPPTVLSNSILNPILKGWYNHEKINLKDYYAHITKDTYIDIPDEVFDIFEEKKYIYIL